MQKPKTKKIITLLYIHSLLFLSGCSLDKDFIINHRWKYGGGYWLYSDVISFDRVFCTLRNDTIFFADSAVAIIYETEKELYLNGNEIHIKSIRTNEIGVYHDF